MSYTQVDNTYHLKTTTHGEYCSFCFGTHKDSHSVLEQHNLKQTVVSQLANQRFVVTDTCDKCGYSRTSYTGAKIVVTNYFGYADGAPHTIIVSDLSEAGVSVSIRYGNSAESCTLTSAPNYTQAGYYTVYYAVTYTYKGVSMTENGVAYVWLLDKDTNDGDKNCTHNFVYHDTVPSGCLTLGYDRYLCPKCGAIEKRNYTAALGHIYHSVVIRDATCETQGKVLEICARCGDVKVAETPKGEHKYETFNIAATCTSPGYTLKVCSVCGDRHITNITNALPHNYRPHVTPATCTTGGRTTHLCDGCGSSFITDYTPAHGHKWDSGKAITVPTCGGAGVTQYTCIYCGATRLEAADAKGHRLGPEATCTGPQICLDCGAILKLPLGHKASDWIIDKEPTFDGDGHRYKKCLHCGEVMESEKIEKLYHQATMDSTGKAVVGDYTVIVTDTNTGNPVAGATVTLYKDNSISILLPNGRLLDYAKQTTVAVYLTKGMIPVSNMTIKVTDANKNYSSGFTGKDGKITVPAGSGMTNDDGTVTVGYEDADGNRHTLKVKVARYETGRPIPDAKVSIGNTGTITVVLPDGEDMDENHRIVVTVTDNKDVPQPDLTVIVKSDLGRTERGVTGKDGKIIVPPLEVKELRHGAYIVGYPDGSVGPENSMTRAEAATVFTRLLAENRGDVIRANAYNTFPDVNSGEWYAGYVGYLQSYNVLTGYNDGTFGGNNPVTRAEFVTMAVRFYEALNGEKATGNTSGSAFSDVYDSYWAVAYIRAAADNQWVTGYPDGTFQGDKEITRAEVVTIVNRLLGREADKAYINANLKKLNTFSDLQNPYYWAYYNIMEAANSHILEYGGDGETWREVY